MTRRGSIRTILPARLIIPFIQKLPTLSPRLALAARPSL
jgi:hypothetical protein